jgi:sugar lactone lactonase YvrE
MKKLGALAATLAALGISASPAGATPGDVIVGDSSDGLVLRVKPNTGAKSLVSDDPRLETPSDTVFGPDGTIYVVDYSAFAGNGGVFAINPKTHVTTIVSQDPLFDQPDGIALGPDGDLYVTDISTPGNGRLLRVDLPSGDTTVASDDPLLAGGPIGVVVPPDGSPIVGDVNLAARVDPQTGVATAIADAGDGLVGGEGLVRGPDGTLYMADSTAGIAAINPRSGQVTDLTGPVPTDSYGLAFDFQGRVLTQAVHDVYRVNLHNGTFAPLATFNYPEGMEVEPPRCRGLTATIVGTTQRNVLKGSRFGDVIAGIGGRDSIKGKVGNDRLCGGTGNDRIRDAAGKNRIDCGPGRHDLAITNQKSGVRNCERLVRR